MTAAMDSARKPASRSAYRACWLDRPPRFRSRHRSGVSGSRSSTATDLGSCEVLRRRRFGCPVPNEFGPTRRNASRRCAVGVNSFARRGGPHLVLEAECPPVRPAAGHEKEHWNRQHHIGARGKECHAPGGSLFFVGCRLEATELLLIGPDQYPDIEQHDGAEPSPNADSSHTLR